MFDERGNHRDGRIGDLSTPQRTKALCLLYSFSKERAYPMYQLYRKLSGGKLSKRSV